MDADLGRYIEELRAAHPGLFAPGGADATSQPFPQERDDWEPCAPEDVERFRMVNEDRSDGR